MLKCLPTPPPSSVAVPPSAHPVVGDSYGIAEPPIAPEAPPASKAPWIVAVVGALVLLVGGGFFAVSALGASGGAATPEEAVDALLDSVENEDFITMAEMLEPGERRSLAEPVLTDILPELERLGVFDESFDAASVEGVDFSFTDVSYRIAELPQHPDLVHVYFTGGELSSTFDSSEFPFGDAFRDEFSDELEDDSETEPLEDPDVPLVLVERDGRWYFSGMYTIAENLRLEADEPLPLPSQTLPRLGSETPEAAVQAMIDEMVQLDLRGMIGRLDPNELQVLHRYAPLFIEEAQAELDEAEAEAIAQGYSWSITDVVMEEQIDGDEAIVEIQSFTVDVSGDGIDMALTYSPERISGEFESPDGWGVVEITPQTLSVEGSVEGEDFVIEAQLDDTSVVGTGTILGDTFTAQIDIDEDGVCSRWSVSGPDVDEEGCLEEDTAGSGMLLTDQYALLLEQLDDGFPGIPVVTRETDGEWYVAPIGTGIHQYVATLRQLEPGDFDAMFGGLGASAQLGLTGPLLLDGGDDVFFDDDFPDEAVEAFPTTTVPFDEVVVEEEMLDEFVDDEFDDFFADAKLVDYEVLASTSSRIERTGSLEFNTFDAFEVLVPEGTQLTVSLEAAEGSLLDPLVAVWGPDGEYFENDDAGPGAGLNDTFDSQVVVDVVSGGTYVIDARSFADGGDGDYVLTVEIG